MLSLHKKNNYFADLLFNNKPTFIKVKKDS